MKKILLITILIFILNLYNINLTSANSLDHKLYKSISLSTIQIKKDYGNKINKKIVTIFIKYRYEKNTEKLNKLQNILKSKITKLNNKKLLSKNNKKILNLYNNLYYRTELLLKYILK